MPELDEENRRIWETYKNLKPNHSTSQKRKRPTAVKSQVNSSCPKMKRNKGETEVKHKWKTFLQSGILGANVENIPWPIGPATNPLEIDEKI